MIGNREAAERALDANMPILSRNGSTRNVYIEDGIVYKVNNGWENEDYNVIELENIEAIPFLPEGVFIPGVSLYTFDSDTVLAMEYVEGIAIAQCHDYMTNEECREDCMTDAEADLISQFIDDTSGYNVIRNSTGLHIIDLG